YIEQNIDSILRRADIDTKVMGKDVLPMAGEYVGEVLLKGVAGFLEKTAPAFVDRERIGRVTGEVDAIRKTAAEALGAPVPPRPPTFCTGCPERPVFTAIKLAEREVGKLHVAADIGCHTFSTLPPFNIGNSVLGYGLGLSSAAAVGPAMSRRVVSIMGDGGFWHNGLTSGVSGAVFNNTDGVLVIMNNGYTSATGQQFIPSTGRNARREPTGMTIRKALEGMGVGWIRTVTTYRVSKMVKTLREAITGADKGLKVIIADSECQLARQRRLKPKIREKLARGERVVRTKFGVDEDLCTGDHSCIRL